MIAESNVLDTTSGTARPAAFEPELARTLALPEQTPGWDVGPERRIDDGRTMARMLGWASIGLGALEVLAPSRLAEFLGIDEENAGFIRAMGVREIAQGVVILSSKDPTPGVFARIAGDALDIAALGAAMSKEGSNKGAVLGSLGMVAGITALDVICAAQLTSQPN